MVLAKPALQYASAIWAPVYRCHIDAIAPVQGKFLLFALRDLRWDSGLIVFVYEHRLKLIDLSTLENGRECLGVLFMAKLLRRRYMLRGIA